MTSLLGLLPDGVDDPYKVLGIDRDVTSKEVRKAYRRRARDIHPDKCPNDPDAEVNFHRLQAAFEFLEDPKKRIQYDEYLKKEQERRERFEKQTAEKKKFTEKLEKAEQQGKKQQSNNSATVNDECQTARQLRKEELKRAREENEKWLLQHQRSSKVDPQPSSSIDSSISKGFVEVQWNPTQSLLGVTKASLLFHFEPFNNPILHFFDSNNGKAILQFPSRESAIESSLHFIQNKKKFPFTVKFLRHPPTITESTSPPPSVTSSIQPLSVQPEVQNLADVETDVLSRLKQAVGIQYLLNNF